MRDPVDIDFERKRRSRDNTELSPEDLLRMALADLEEGRHPNAKKCLILIVEEHPDGRNSNERYRCGVTRSEEAGLLALWQFCTLEAWLT